MMRTAHQSTETSIAKEVMPAKREMKILSTKRGIEAEIGPMNVDNFANSRENSKIEKIRVLG